MEKVFEQVINNIQDIINSAKIDEEISSNPIEKGYLYELIKALEGIIYDHKDIDFLHMLSYVEIIWEIYDLFRLKNGTYSELTKYYVRQLDKLYDYVISARPRYILETIMENTKSNDMIRIKDIVRGNSIKLRNKREEYYAAIHQIDDGKNISNGMDFGRLQEEYFYAKETNIAFCSVTSLSYTKSCLEYIIDRACILKESLQDEDSKSILSLIIYRLIGVSRVFVVGINYFELVFNSINESLSLLNNSSLNFCELITELKLLLARLNCEKELSIKKFMENDLTVVGLRELDNDELIKVVSLRIKEKSDDCVQFEKSNFQRNCPGYTYADKYTYDVQTAIIYQLRRLDKLFQRQMILFALKELRDSKVKRQ